MLEHLRKQLLKVPSIKRAVEDYKARKKEAQRKEHWAKLMSSNYTYRKAKESNLEKHDTLGVVTLEEYRGGKVVDRETMILESTNWGGTRL